MGFWDIHGVMGGVLYLLVLCALPRFSLACLAILFGSIGVTLLGLIGWIILPRLTVAIIGAGVYWDTNPYLCAISFPIAFAGEMWEKERVRLRRAAQNKKLAEQ